MKWSGRYIRPVTWVDGSSGVRIRLIVRMLHRRFECRFIHCQLLRERIDIGGRTDFF